MEVAPSLFNVLQRLREEGYDVGALPLPLKLERMINENGKVFNSYALGAMEDFVNKTNPEIIDVKDYDRWCAMAFSKR